MIAKISSGQSTAGLIRYLYDTKKAKDHTDPHLIASWDGFAPDPGRADDFDATKRHLVADLDLHVKQAERLGRAPDKYVWHCSIRAAETDRHLSDEEWADIARRVVAATGIAPDGDPDGCRWVAVRHAPDHIHIAATKVRADLRTARHWNDYLTADRELAAIEKEYGLFQIVRGDRTAAKRPTRAEQEKATRAGHAHTAREQLRTTVRTAVAAATSTTEFIGLLQHTDGIFVDVKHFPSGDVRGYTVALQGDTNGKQEPIWYSGSELSPDLSFPKIRKRLDATDQPHGQRRANPWHQATAAAERIPHRLEHGEDTAAQAHLAALGEALDALPFLAPPDIRPQLRQAAEAFERATRSRIQAEHQHARALRGAVRAMVREPAPKDGALLAMFLDAAILTVIAAARWHQLRPPRPTGGRSSPDPGPSAGRLRTNCHRAADRARPASATPAGGGAAHPLRPADRARSRGTDPAGPHLRRTRRRARGRREGRTRPHQLLQQAADQRALDDARRPARVLTWRVERLSTRSAPSARARAAQAQSPARRTSTAVQSPSAAPASPPQPPQARRR